jgi:hypothetical protein
MKDMTPLLTKALIIFGVFAAILAVVLAIIITRASA